jgi:thiol-disulfide isomerase/thioredoxin
MNDRYKQKEEDYDSKPLEPGTKNKARDPNVVVLGPGVLLIPLMFLVIAGGYFTGRWWRGRNAPAQTAAVSTPAAAGANDASRFVITVDPSVSATAQAQAALQQRGPDLKTVYDLRPSTHQLMFQQAPDFTMTRLSDGAQVTLSETRGQTVLINFWATWCPPCRLEMPWLQSVYEKYKDQGFDILAVNAGERVPAAQVEATVQHYIDQASLTFPVLIGDNAFAVQRDYAVYGLPASFILDTEGNVIHEHGGAYPNEPTLEKVVRESLGLGEVATEAGS